MHGFVVAFGRVDGAQRKLEFGPGVCGRPQLVIVHNHDRSANWLVDVSLEGGDDLGVLWSDTLWVDRLNRRERRPEPSVPRASESREPCVEACQVRPRREPAEHEPIE